MLFLGLQSGNNDEDTYLLHPGIFIIIIVSWWFEEV